MSATHLHDSNAAPGGTGKATAGGPTAPAGKPPTPSWRMIVTLAVAGAIAGLLIVTVHQWAEPRILANQARVIAATIDEVLQGPASTVTLYMNDGALVTAPPAGQDTMKLERVWAGYDGNGRLIGYALMAGEPGFQDVIRIMFGYDLAADRVLGMRVLESKETPGLGDLIEKDSVWVAQFDAAGVPLIQTKPGGGTGDPREVETITGATISSRVVIGTINRRIEQMRPLLQQVGGGQ
ncbi:MAG: FMN-binding protein [Gemmatimonadetes bacterium]|nr:FMN-binding protein [Gemmatimonadota bacterium]